MKWSWKLAEIAGIGVYMHATFLLLIGWIVLNFWTQGGGILETLEAVVFVLSLFACVVLHELGHALTAKRYGILTRDITLLPIGGVARLERMPDEPKQELWVALAGPSVNLVIAAVLFVLLAITGASHSFSQLGVVTGSFLGRLMVVNLFLIVFNMLPAFPMDGGRVLRALLATRMDYTRATEIAASMGQGMALLFGFFGFLSNPFLLFIAFFVWIGATQEANMVKMKTALGGIPVSRAMVTRFQTVSPDQTLARAVELVLSGSQHDFPVVDGERVVGVLTRGDLLRALAERDQSTSIADVMQKDFQVADSSEMLEAAFARLQSCDCSTLPVLRLGKLIGLLTMDNVGEFVSIQVALSTSSRLHRAVEA